MAKARQFMTDGEKQVMWQEMRLKGELTNLKEARMSLPALKKKIGKELYTKGFYGSDWLIREQGLWTDYKRSANGQFQGMTVNRTYNVDYCIWPRQEYGWSSNVAYGVDRRIESTERTETIPLADYWRLALSGKGL